MAYGKRSFGIGPWHYDARLDYKTHISDMGWQRGKLIRTDTFDKYLIGDREAEIALVLGDGKEELAPDPKLQEPDVITQNDDIFI
jgi:hypothetical protein